MTRDDAYRVVQESAQRAWGRGDELPRADRRGRTQARLDAIFDYDAYLKHVPEVIARLDRLAA